MMIENVTSSNFAELLMVWEDSVRATHDFISEADIAEFKPMIIEHAFPAVTLRCVRGKSQKILGFIGVAENKIEMLFVLNKCRGQGIGKQLLNFAINELGATKLDVNEQNPLAVEFYKHMGFDITSRSPLDDMGKPFPILHMSL
ncbi:MAG: GNAT family N-acetyltransferase [Psychrobium sp.]